jgi:hypothetical protein
MNESKHRPRNGAPVILRLGEGSVPPPVRSAHAILTGARTDPSPSLRMTDFAKQALLIPSIPLFRHFSLPTP